VRDKAPLPLEYQKPAVAPVRRRIRPLGIAGAILLVTAFSFIIQLRVALGLILMFAGIVLNAMAGE
jgi:hypothetical protein